MEDSVVALLALHANEAGRFTVPLDPRAWAYAMNAAGLYEEHWLLAYEANVKGWGAAGSCADYVAAEPNFGALKAAGVSFYEIAAAAAPAPATPIPTPRRRFPIGNPIGYY